MSRFSVIPAAAVVDKRLTLRELSVLAAIGLHTDRNGWCYPSSERLGELLGVSGAMVRRSIGELAKAGYLELRERRNADGGRTSNLIRVLFDAQHPAGQMRSAGESVGTAPPATPEVTAPATPAVATPATPEVAVTDPFNNPINDTPQPPKGGARKRALVDDEFVLPGWVPAEPWAEWLKVRKKKRASNTPFALKRALRILEDLVALGQDPAEVITQSAYRGWTDLYAIDRKEKTHAAQPTDPFARRRGESLVEHVQRVNRIHDEREARERQGA